MANPLQRLAEYGQSVWLDFISRDLVTSGELQRLVREENVTGLTSNPTIFQKAIAEGSSYDEQIRELVASGVDDPNEVFYALAIRDIRAAADVLREVYERTDGGDGFVSLEVSPAIAHDTQGTVDMVRTLWDRVDRPNLMVKIPATPEGLGAIKQSLRDGRNVNVTLIFALTMYERVIDQYIAALEERVSSGDDVRGLHSVASFFVSRVDTAVDKLIDEKLAEDPGNATLEGLHGKAAVANAVLAYEMFERRFNDARFAALRNAGAHVQRPLWASTSAKNPNYRDVVYAEALIGPHTVDTMPPQTVEAFKDHGIVDAITVNQDYAGAHQVMEQLAEAGIDVASVTEQLLREGVQSFADSYTSLIREIALKMDRLHGCLAERQHFDLGATTSTVTDAFTTDATTAVARRVWNRDPDLWKPGDAEHAEVIRNRLGWLDVIDTMRDALPRLLSLQSEVRDAGWRDCVLLGMGGSSLCPEVLRTSFGSAAGQPVLHVLDTTDPAAIETLTSQLEPAHTGFIVASKSGGTLETLSHLAHFWEVVRAGGVPNVGAHFIAITDPGTSLAETAHERGFRHLFENPPDIGGRYSALSFFGLVPAAIAGIDVEELLRRADDMRRQCAASLPGDLNCGLALGTTIGLMHAAKRDKVTILTPPRIAAFSLWAEQLIAESTGKDGKGIIPIGDEPVGGSAVYGDDRLFIALRLGEDDAFDRSVGALRTAGQPVVTLELNDLHDLAAEFFRWEFATAVAGASLGIDPFDEPNVQESKDNTKRVLSSYEQSHRLDDVGADATAMQLREHIDAAKEGDYIALLAYVTPDAANHDALQRLRVAIRDSTRRATQLGFGPRYMHSTGQLHKGGPNTGVFVEITCDDAVDVSIPGQPYTFSVLKQAQALGDLESLRAHQRRVIRVHVGGDVVAGVERLTEAVGGALAAR
jgi:transaldolase / glucose-6-phosphate isomerase